MKYASSKAILLLITLSVLTIFISTNQHRPISGDLDCNLLSDPIKTMFSTALSNKPAIFDYAWFLVKIDNEKIQYFSSQPKLERVHKLVDALREIEITYPHKLPEGEYLIALDDGVNHELPWPVLAFASTKELVQQRMVVLMPDHDALGGYEYKFKYVQQAIHNYPWGKKQAKIFWRGTANGHDALNIDIYQHPRLNFMKFLSANQDLDFVDAGFTGYANWFSHYPPYASSITEVKQKFPPKNMVTVMQSIQNKYLLDIDGNSCSYSRMAWILYSNSLLMKHSSNKVQWYYDQLQPNVHYLPISSDFSNLSQQFAWAESHQVEVITITANAHNLASAVFNKEAVLQATITAFEQYNQVTAPFKGTGFDKNIMQQRMLKELNAWTPELSKTYLAAVGLTGNEGIRPNIIVEKL